MSDGIITPDQLNGNIVENTGMNTRVIITAKNCRSEGSFEQEVRHNQTALPGRTQLLESVFPIVPNVDDQHIFLNDNVLGAIDQSGANSANVETVKLTGLDDSKLPRNNPALFRRRKVAYWCAGDGAMNRTVMSQAYAPHSTNTRLYHMIPFLVVDDISSIDKSMYKFIVRYSGAHPLAGKYGAYFKKIEMDLTNGINMIVDKVPYKPSWGDTNTDLNIDVNGYVNKFKGDKTQMNYVDLKMRVAANEFKQWFTLTDGTVANASISEIGLITGYDGYLTAQGTLNSVEDLRKDDPQYTTNSRASEVLDAELFAHLTFDPYPVSRENNTLEFDYRIYS